MVTHLTVTAVEQLTPVLRRLWFRSDDLSAFEGSDFTDRYVKLIFPKPGVTYPEPLDPRALRGLLPAEDLPAVRTYTALSPDLAAGTLAIDFVIHGDEGVAGPWAARAQPGDELMVNGPGGAYRPDADADWYLFVGDESALPAITAALTVLPATAVARALILVDSEDHEPDLSLPDGVEVTFLHRGAALAEGQLAEAVRSMPWLPGRVDAFVHGEAHEVMQEIRPYLLTELGLAREQVSISGYWRRGRTEEGFREWKRELAGSEGGRSGQSGERRRRR